MSVELSQTEQEKMMERITKSVGSKPYREGRFSVSQDELSFYKDASLVRMTNFAAMPAVTKTYICSGADVFQADGTPESIDEINEKIGLTLNEKNVADYVSFFFSQVVSDEGQFHLISKAEDLPNFKSFGADLSANLQELILAPEVETEEDGFILRAHVLFGTTLFKTAIIVSKTGEVDVDDDEAVYENLPVQKPKRR